MKELLGKQLAAVKKWSVGKDLSGETRVFEDEHDPKSDSKVVYCMELVHYEGDYSVLVCAPYSIFPYDKGVSEQFIKILSDAHPLFEKSLSEGCVYPSQGNQFTFYINGEDRNAGYLMMVWMRMLWASPEYVHCAIALNNQGLDLYNIISVLGAVYNKIPSRTSYFVTRFDLGSSLDTKKVAKKIKNSVGTGNVYRYHKAAQAKGRNTINQITDAFIDTTNYSVSFPIITTKARVATSPTRYLVDTPLIDWVCDSELRDSLSASFEAGYGEVIAEVEDTHKKAIAKYEKKGGIKCN